MDVAVAPSPALLFHVSGRIGGPSGGPSGGASGGPSGGQAGRPADGALRPLRPGALRPAVLARYRELDGLRHDFPIVLTPGRESVQTLAGLVDRMLGDVAPRGIDGERLRRHALQLETSIRGAVAAGRSDTLAVLWDEAAARLAEREGGPLEQVLQHAGSALAADGPVLGCDSRMPAQLLRHAWQAAQRAKARQFRADLARLVQKLSDILRAARSHSAAGREPQALRAALGAPHHAQFDFTRLSRFVAKGLPADELPAARRQRLERTLAVLESQRFFGADHDDHDDRNDRDGTAGTTHGFEFADCLSASLAFRQRLPEAAELVKAIAVAELEARGAYVEAEHDLVFEAFGPHSLGADDLARLPDYLVCIAPGDNEAPANAMLMSLLSSGMPVKVLVQTTELGDDGPIGELPQAFGVRSARLATAAMALGGMFVLQAAASQLFALRARIAAGLAARGPALFSVYTPVDGPIAGAGDGANRESGMPVSPLPAYLRAACAAESRAFASFVYDAAAGPNWATRFSLQGNREPEADWPGHTLEYADARQQRCTERVAFTYVDFALTDPRLAGHFAVLPADDAAAADPALLPAAEWLALPAAEAARHAPTVLAVDADDRLHRVVADSRLMQAAQRCLLLWHRLQEHAGIHDSHAQALLAREKAAWAAAATSAPAAAAAASSAPAAATASTASTAAAPAGSGEHTRDEAWIETARCPSCNECQRINDRMFGYDERKQAYLKDLAAGSYRQLVEAAESCQVAIIHPGKPRDPNEPGLEALLLRAEPFR